VKIHTNFVNFHKILLKFTKIRNSQNFLVNFTWLFLLVNVLHRMDLFSCFLYWKISLRAQSWCRRILWHFEYQRIICLRFSCYSFSIRSICYFGVFRILHFGGTISICFDSKAALLTSKSYAVSSRVALKCGFQLFWIFEHCDMRRPMHLQGQDQVLLLWAQSFVFRWQVRVSSGGSGSGFLNHTARHGASRLLVVNR
jgi:hypothetical protein